jgi:hypothetical protein
VAAIYQQLATTGAATAVILDWTQTPFNASIAVSILTGTCTYGVQYTLDNPNSAIDLGSANTTVTWLTDVNIPTGTTTSAIAGNYMFPVRAVRLNVASLAGIVQFAVIQGLPP